MSDELVAFSRSDADEIIRKTFSNETFSGFDGLLTADATSLVLAFTVAGATARSGTTLGTGTASRRYLAESGSGRTITTSTDTVPFYNVAASAVGANKYILLLRLGTNWICVWEECSSG
jgi:hypothetical protein